MLSHRTTPPSGGQSAPLPHRGAGWMALGIIAAESLLIGLLLVERSRRTRTQPDVEEQAAHERTIAKLTPDTRHHVREGSRPIVDARAHVDEYARARVAVLVQHGDVAARFETRRWWPDPIENGNATAATTRSDSVSGDVPRTVAVIEEEINRAVFASLSSPIAILDRNGTIIRVNDAWREVARSGGVDPRRDTFVGENYLDECRRAERRGCEVAREIRCGIEAVLKCDQRRFRCEYHLALPDESRWYELSVEPLEHVDGGAVATHVDITDRRLAEIRAEETRRQVAHMGRVALVAELAASLSHELRQPLAAIRANAQAGALMLAHPPADLNEAKAIFADIVADDIRASEIIDHVRTLLRKEEPATTSVDLNEICRHAAHLLQRDALLRGAQLQLALDPALPLVTGDPVQLQQVVINLALNALEAAAASAGTREVTLGTAVRNGEIGIFVRDTGPGLAPEVQRHLFAAFFSTKAHGLGMGLVIVRSIVERHHGRVCADNSSGGGAVFRVFLPATEVTIGPSSSRSPLRTATT